MFGILTDSDATVAVALIGGAAGIAVAIVAARNSYSAKKELRPNGGSSALDKMTRRFDGIEQTLVDHSSLLDRLISDRAHDRLLREERQAELDARLDRLEGRR